MESLRPRYDNASEAGNLGTLSRRLPSTPLWRGSRSIEPRRLLVLMPAPVIILRTLHPGKAGSAAILRLFTSSFVLDDVFLRRLLPPSLLPQRTADADQATVRRKGERRLACTEQVSSKGCP